MCEHWPTKNNLIVISFIALSITQQHVGGHLLTFSSWPSRSMRQNQGTVSLLQGERYKLSFRVVQPIDSSLFTLLISPTRFFFLFGCPAICFFFLWVSIRALFFACSSILALYWLAYLKHYTWKSRFVLLISQIDLRFIHDLLTFVNFVFGDKTLLSGSLGSFIYLSSATGNAIDIFTINYNISDYKNKFTNSRFTNYQLNY